MKKKLLALFMILSMVFTFAACGSDEHATDDEGTAQTTQQEEPQETEEPEEEPEPEATVGEQNALEMADQYLSSMSFSKKGLRKQLEFEGFTESEAKYAVNNCGANWKEQAVLKAEEYLNSSSFSKQGLIDQLIFEGFTKKQAEYGVDKAYK